MEGEKSVENKRNDYKCCKMFSANNMALRLLDPKKQVVLEIGKKDDVFALGIIAKPKTDYRIHFYDNGCCFINHSAKVYVSDKKGASIDQQFQSFRQAFEKAEGIRTGTESFRNEVYDTEKVTVDGTILKFLYSQTEGELKYLVLGEDIFDVLLLEYKSFDDWFVIPSDYKKKGVLEMVKMLIKLGPVFGK